jgi:hypothetical protein
LRDMHPVELVGHVHRRRDADAHMDRIWTEFYWTFSIANTVRTACMRLTTARKRIYILII